MPDMIENVRAAYGAALRVHALVLGLDQSARVTDALQVSAGLKHEMRTVVDSLAPVLDALEASEHAATANGAGKVRSDAPATSRTAARAVTIRTGSQRYAILAHLLARGAAGATDLEIQEATELGPNSERPRRGELVDLMLVRPDGTRSHAGMDWTVWRLTPAGDAVVRRILNGQSGVVPATAMTPESVSPVDADQPDPVLF